MLRKGGGATNHKEGWQKLQMTNFRLTVRISLKVEW